jgi:hypothetical protein
VKRLLPACVVLALGAAAQRPALADTATVAPVADAFVDSAQPSKNYGGGGALAVASASAPKGEFQSLLRFDTSAAAAQFDASLGPGLWVVSSASLRLSAASPNNNLFNAQAAGQFAVSWMADDAWVEGSGTPAQPGTTGVSFDTLSSFLGPLDEALGTFAFAGETTGSTTYPLLLAPGFAGDLGVGGTVSLRLLAADNAVAYLFNSRSFSAQNQPALVLTAVARCPADFDHSGSLGVPDIFAFLEAWFAGDPHADFNGADGIGVPDIFDFLNAWFEGC